VFFGLLLLVFGFKLRGLVRSAANVVSHAV
jgi:hypothetical protein